MKAVPTTMFSIHDCRGRWREFGGSIFCNTFIFKFHDVMPLFSISV